MPIGARTRSRGRARAGELWTPKAIDHRLIAWLSSFDPRNVDDIAVGTWIDRSSNGADATQGTTDNKPSWSPDALDGHPGLVFGGGSPAGGGDWLEFDGAPFYDAGSTAGAMFFIAKLEQDPPPAPAYCGHIVSMVGDGSNDPGFWNYTDGKVYDSFFVDTRFEFTPGVDLSTPTIGAATHDGSTVRWYNNCVLDYSNNDSVTLYDGNPLNTAIGRTMERTYTMDGVISEIVLIDGPVDDRLRYIIEGYLAHTYGNAWRIADGHPYKYRPPLLSDM